MANRLTQAERRLALRGLCKIRGFHEAPHIDRRRCVDPCECGVYWHDLDGKSFPDYWGWPSPTGEMWRWPVTADRGYTSVPASIPAPGSPAASQ